MSRFQPSAVHRRALPAAATAATQARAQLSGHRVYPCCGFSGFSGLPPATRRDLSVTQTDQYKSGAVTATNPLNQLNPLNPHQAGLRFDPAQIILGRRNDRGEPCKVQDGSGATLPAPPQHSVFARSSQTLKPHCSHLEGPQREVGTRWEHLEFPTLFLPFLLFLPGYAHT